MCSPFPQCIYHMHNAAVLVICSVVLALYLSKTTPLEKDYATIKVSGYVKTGVAQYRHMYYRKSVSITEAEPEMH